MQAGLLHWWFVFRSYLFFLQHFVSHRFLQQVRKRYRWNGIIERLQLALLGSLWRAGSLNHRKSQSPGIGLCNCYGPTWLVTHLETDLLTFNPGSREKNTSYFSQWSIIFQIWFRVFLYFCACIWWKQLGVEKADKCSVFLYKPDASWLEVRNR